MNTLHGMRLSSLARCGTDGLRYRFSCEKLILHDFDCALDNVIEQKLWDAHVKVNKRYQKLLSLVNMNLLEAPPPLMLD